ncbi:MAG: nitroreductase family protein [candidate division WOR-3 bacterium]|nr:MAG: nitroreductase family protein [candidate division WOR-3 bacterium]
MSKPARKQQDPTLKLLTERSSCRNFYARKIPERVLSQVLEAGVHAPTGGNLQPYSIIRIEKAQTRSKLAELCGQAFIGQAPVDLLFCIDWHRSRRWAELEQAPFTATDSFRHFWISFQDTIICAQNICTAADAVGLGSVYVGTVMDLMPDLRRILRLPEGVLPVVLLSLGYPRTRPSPRPKLGADVVVHRDWYRELPARELRAAHDEKYQHFGFEMKPEKLKRLEQACRKAHGAKFARECVDGILRRGHINMAQQYFGLHYFADVMPAHNDMFLKWMREFGFGWFRKWRPRR